MIDGLEKDAVEKHIIETSKQVFIQFGYKKVTMNDIAQVSGKGRSTIYHYFKNKHEVFENVAMQLFQSVLESSARFISSQNSFVENLYQFHTNKLKDLSLVSKQYLSLVKDLREDEKIMIKVDEITLRTEQKYAEEMIRLAITNEDISAMDDEAIKQAGGTIVTTLHAFAKDMIFWGRANSTKDHLKPLINMLAKGI